ncbi:hypothetical protein [Microvirga roseola]|uniref:hypothetical protein n=1 Tax=Microvirga roseola TaxID=2883126 RepID=UPI001E529B71|nr:hypothetical protein [Microvirga roseola]
MAKAGAFTTTARKKNIRRIRVRKAAFFQETDVDTSGALAPEDQARAKIAQCVQHFDIESHPVWSEVIGHHPGASLFVTEASPESVEILSSGEFTTRAHLLVDVPVKYPDGFETEGSVTIPAFVTGRLEYNGDVVFKEFKLSVNHLA